MTTPTLPNLTREQRIALRDGARAELSILDLRYFVRFAWPLVEPGTPLIPNWHIDAICDAVMRQFNGEESHRRLLIMQPPGTMKSLVTSVMAPAWRWLHQPWRRVVFVSNDQDLATRDSRRMRDIVTSDWYRGLVDRLHHRGYPAWKLTHDQNEKANFENSMRGFRQGYSIGGKILGKRGHDINIDDPVDAHEVINGSAEQVARRLAEVQNVIDKILPSRVNKLDEACWTLVMQRLAPDDPAGKALIEGGWHVINLQMEFDPANPRNHPDDPRTEPGQLLFPAMFPRDEVERLKRKLGSLHYNAQYQQSPEATEGSVFKAAWLQSEYDEDPHVLARTLDEVVLSVDAANKPGATNDNSVIQAIGRRGPHRFMLDEEAGQWDINALCDNFDVMVRRWPMARRIFVEDKGHGTTLLQLREVPGMVGINPKGDKASRAGFTAAVARAGQLHLPKGQPWVVDWRREHAGFLAGARHDDRVDATSQAMKEWAEAERAWFDEAAIRSRLESVVPDTRDKRLYVRPERRVSYVVGVAPSWCTGGTPAVMQVLDDRGAQVATHTLRTGGDTKLIDAIAELSTWYNKARVLCAAVPGGPGPVVVKGLRTLGVPTWTRADRYAGDAGANWEGGRALASALARLREEFAMGGVTLHDHRTLVEMLTLREVDDAIVAQDEAQTQHVLALALAVLCKDGLPKRGGLRGEKERERGVSALSGLR